MSSTQKNALQKPGIWILERNTLVTLVSWAYLTTGVNIVVIYTMLQHEIDQNLISLLILILTTFSIAFMIFVYIPAWENHYKSEQKRS